MDDLYELKLRVREFAEDRDWGQFHTPKDLAIGIATEAAELLQRHRFKDPEFIPAGVDEELADVLIFAIRYADVCGIDLGRAVIYKLFQNAERYPVEIARGSNRKYNESPEATADPLDH